MIAFEVYLNGKKLCLAGVGNNGVLAAITDYVTGTRPDRLHLHVGGLLSSKDEHVRWRDAKLNLGDEITIRIVETISVDRPRERKRRNPAEEQKLLKQYIRTTAKQLGWRIITKPTKNSN
jgi:hypothetical protein